MAFLGSMLRKTTAHVHVVYQGRGKEEQAGVNHSNHMPQLGFADKDSSSGGWAQADTCAVR